MTTKSVNVKVKDFNPDEGTFVGYASTYGNLDKVGDIVVKGAFKRSMDAGNTRIPLNYQHNPEKLIGYGDLTDSDGGLLITGHLDKSAADYNMIYNGLKGGYLKNLSIGYEILQDGYEDGAHMLKELRLVETSIVQNPANAQANILSVKSGDADALAVDLLKRVDSLVSDGKEFSPETKQLMAQVATKLSSFSPAAKAEPEVDSLTHSTEAETKAAPVDTKANDSDELDSLYKMLLVCNEQFKQ